MRIRTLVGAGNLLGSASPHFRVFEVVIVQVKRRGDPRLSQQRLRLRLPLPTTSCRSLYTTLLIN